MLCKVQQFVLWKLMRSQYFVSMNLRTCVKLFLLTITSNLWGEKLKYIMPKKSLVCHVLLDRCVSTFYSFSDLFSWMFNLYSCSFLSEQTSAMMPPKICGMKKQALATCSPPMLVGPVQTFKKVKATDTLACTSSVSRHGLPVTNTGKREELCNLYETPKFGYYEGGRWDPIPS